VNAKARAPETFWIRAASGLEILTGGALVFNPSLVARLLFGEGLSPPGPETGRLAGLALFSLAVGSWPREGSAFGLPGLLLLSVLAAVYLIFHGLGWGVVGVLLWPAVTTHILLAILLARAWRESRRAAG
jgi:hypothetical protein